MLWDIDFESWQSIAGRIANRNLTQAEWRQFFPEEPWRATFPDPAASPKIASQVGEAAKAPSIRRPSTVSEPGKSPAPPGTWQEHWHEHKQLIKLVKSNDDVAIYFDDDMPEKVPGWVDPFITKVWRYTRETYGAFGPDPRLFTICHQGKYEGCHSANYFDNSHDHRNVVDWGRDSWDDARSDLCNFVSARWCKSPTTGCTGRPVLKYGETPSGFNSTSTTSMWGSGSRKRPSALTINSPNRPMTSRDRAHTGSAISSSPIGRDYGLAQVMVNFLELLAKHFPKEFEDNGKYERYTRKMNWGEFIHFMSGAAHKDLRRLAKEAFGWPVEWGGSVQEGSRGFSRD